MTPERQKSSLEISIETLGPRDLATIATVFDARIRTLRKEHRIKLEPYIGKRVKIYTQTNEVFGTLQSVATVYASVVFEDGSIERVDLSLVTLPHEINV